MAFPVNQATYVSDEDVKRGQSALFYPEAPGTPTYQTPRWASMQGLRGTKTIMVYFYERDQLSVSFPVKGIKKARGLCKAYVGVTGDGMRYCFGPDDKSCFVREETGKAGILTSTEEIERGYCDGCEAELRARYAEEDGE